MASVLLFTAWAFAGFSAAARCVETTSQIPDGWERLPTAPDPATPVHLSIALRQPNVDGLQSKLMSKRGLSDIVHLAFDDIKLIRQPDQQDVDDVMKWLSDSGIQDAKAEDDWVHVHTTAAKADTLLRMQLWPYTYEHKPAVLRTTSYYVPDSVSRAIDFVHPISNFMYPRREVFVQTAPVAPRSDPLAPPAAGSYPCATVTTPECIRQLYNMQSTIPDGQGISRLGVSGFLEEYVNYGEVQGFLSDMAPEIAKANYNFTVESVNGGINPQGSDKSGTEASLDMDYIMALGYPSQVTFYSAAGRGKQEDDSGKQVDPKFATNEPYLEFLDYLLAKPDDQIPHVLSLSYSDDETSVPRPYAKRVCDMLGMLTARGTTVLAGSGDGGARGARSSSCSTNDGSKRDIAMTCFPPTCPWVTAVGAVVNNANPPTGAEFSTGGFSTYFKREDWQGDAIDGYVRAIGDHLKGTYDSSMRATPDISAIGTQFLTRVGGSTITVGGTSASTPVIAAMISLVNNERLRNGKKSIGFLNDLLYTERVKAVLQDITAGESIACEFQHGHASGGWPAKPGFDAITGLGVPNDFQRLMQVLIDV